MSRQGSLLMTILVAGLSVCMAATAESVPAYDSEIIVQVGEYALEVDGYSVPTAGDLNGDGLFDLVVGDGGGGVTPGLVRLYFNSGTPGSPEFDSWSYAQVPSGPLYVPAAGCMGVCPRVTLWNGDQLLDLLVGTADGLVLIFLNTGSSTEPFFAEGVAVQVGRDEKIDIDVGTRATPLTVDWNNDQRLDLVVGAYDGRIRVFVDEADTGDADFEVEMRVQDPAGDLVVPSLRSSPLVGDLDGDGRKDLICGNTEGQLLFFQNIGTDAEPAFGSPEPILAGDVPVDLEGSARSRPCACDWNNDGIADLIVGGSDGLVHLFLGRAVSAVEGIPVARAQLLTPRPNPFNPRTAILFTMDQPGLATLSVADLRGRIVAVLASATYGPGTHRLTWNGQDAAGRAVASGTYYVRLQTTEGVQSRPMTLLR